MTKAALYWTCSLKNALPKNEDVKSAHLELVNPEPVCLHNEGSNFTAVILRCGLARSAMQFQIILAHPLHGHSVIVADYDNDLDIVADWRFIGKRLNLPLFSLSSEGYLEIFSEHSLGENRSRRFGSPLSGRRTRFSGRRKTGKTILNVAGSD